MSHLGTRLIADRLADGDEGANSIMQEMTDVLHDGDPLPGDTITVYDDTRDGWVARGIAPPQDDPLITYPMLRVVTMGVDYTAGVPDVQATGAVTVSGTLRVMVQVILRGSDTAGMVAAGMYWLRVVHGVLVRFDDPANEGARSFGGIRLYPATSIAQGKVDAPPGDNLVSPGAFLLTYPFIETVPLPLSLH